MTGSEKDLQDNVNVWNEVLTKNGMKINKMKTKVMAIAGEQEIINIEIEET